MTTTATRPETVYEREVRRARDQFDAAVTEHEMTVLLDTIDDGTPYRHVRFARPGTGMWSFNLVTWPGHLAISGDFDSFTFRRLHDMFGFFRSSVNPSYWGEKVVAGAPCTDHGEARFSSERYIEAIHDRISWYDHLEPDDLAAFKAHVQAELLDSPAEYLETAHEALASFRWESETTGRRIEFTDTWEWDLGGFDHHFLLSIHAIRWGVAKYLAAHPGRFIPEGRQR